MYSADGWGNRGEHIIPSARKSIHSHSCCPFAATESAMDTCGTEKRNVKGHKKSTTLLEEGHDEVDNVVSKFAYASNEVPISPRKIQRRHSFNSENQDYSGDDSKILSKSLPEKFPSHLYSSDDSQAGDTDAQYQSFESSQGFSQSSHNLLIQGSFNRGTVLPRQQNRDNHQPVHFSSEEVQTNHSSYSKIWNISIVIFCIVIMCIFRDSLPIMQDKNISTRADNYDKLKFYNDMSAIGEMYKLNQDTILELKVGISSISEREDTDSFIFVYNSENVNFNSTILNEFINEIASISAKYLRNESASVRHIVVDTSSIMVKNSDELIHKYSDDITRGGVMVMRKLDMLPSSLAMALHYYCDVFNPLVRKSAMFFTLDIANCSDKMSTHSYIEKCLKKKWSGVSNEFIGPLLARVVSVVVDVTTLF